MTAHKNEMATMVIMTNSFFMAHQQQGKFPLHNNDLNIVQRYGSSFGDEVSLSYVHTYILEYCANNDLNFYCAKMWKLFQ